jgi:hypothetical protein
MLSIQIFEPQPLDMDKRSSSYISLNIGMGVKLRNYCRVFAATI